MDHPHPMEVFFQYWRDQRRERYAQMIGGKGATKTRAVITIVHNEAVFFPLWLDYYGRFFEPEDIYVLDNDSTDGSTCALGFNRMPVTHDRVDHQWMVDQLQALQHELIERYDVVLVTDVDELITPIPEHGDLGEYIDRFEEPFVNAIGYELIHLEDREAPIDLARPILAQRHHWFANDAYDKPALAMEPMQWKPGLCTSGWTRPTTSTRTCASSTCTGWTTSSAATDIGRDAGVPGRHAIWLRGGPSTIA